MIRRYSPYDQQSAAGPSQSSDQAAFRWWRPLTRWWGIVGVIIFIGFLMQQVESLGHRRASQPVSLSGGQASSIPAARLGAPRLQPRQTNAVR
jgi:hypothetical protein